MNPYCALKNGGRNRWKCECGVVKGAGHPGVQSKCAGTTYFRRIVQKDSCCEHDQVRLVLQRASKCTATTVREPETVMLTVASRVFGRCVPRFIWAIKNACEGIVLGWQPRTTSQVWVLSCPHQWGQKRTGTRFHCVFGALFRCARTLTRITAGLHLHPSTFSCMSTDRSRCSRDTVQGFRLRRPLPKAEKFERSG